MTTFRRVVKLARVTGLQPSSIPYGGTEWVITYYYDLTGRLVRQTEVGSTCDHETGLHFLNSRFYDPEKARFINADAYASTGQGFFGCNMFTYCLNNPLVFEDSAGAAARICISADGTIDDAPWRDHSPSGGGRPYKEYHYQPNKYGDAADKFYTVRFFRALGNGVKMLTGANRIRGSVSKIKEGAQLLFVPCPTVAEDLAGMALIVYGIIDLARGITEFIIGADGE